MTRFNIGDKIQLDSIVKMPSLLQLSFNKVYTILDLARATNPENDNIMVRNDVGRVTTYLARVFVKVNQSMLIKLPITNAGDPNKAAALMVNKDDEGNVTQVVLAFPDSFVDGDDDAMAGLVLFDSTGFLPLNQIYPYLSRTFFQPAEGEIVVKL